MTANRVLRRVLLLLSLASLSATAFAQPDFSKVEITTTKHTDNFYTLDGQGGRIGVLTGPDGVFMVDTQFPPLSDRIAAAIREITDQPIRFIAVTHLHNDHSSGIENFARMGATVVAREELRFRLAHPNPQADGSPGVPRPASGMPVQTYRDAATFHVNGEEVQLIAVPRAHTDGDTMVYFPGVDAIMTGDFYRSVQFPNIDRNNGGTLNGMIDGLGAVIGRAGPQTKVIPGHGPIVDRAAVVAHRDLMLVVRDRIANLIDQGMSEEDVVAANVIADYDGKVQQPGTTGERFVRQAYNELQAMR